MMEKKGFDLKRIVNIQNIIILVIICTIAFYLTHPSLIYKNNNKLKSEYVKFDKGDLLIENPTDESMYYVLLQEGEYDLELRTYYYPMELTRIVQYMDTHIRFNDRFLSTVYITEDKTYITLLKGKSEVWLLTINAIENSYENQLIFKFDSPYWIFQDSTITKNNNKFYKHVIFEDDDLEQTYIQKYKDGFRVCFTQTVFLELRKFYNYYELHTCDEYNLIAKLLNETISPTTSFDAYDVYDLVYYFNARHFHNQKYFEDMKKEYLPIICKIIGMNDVNMDGHDDILIQLDGDRFFPKILIAYDVTQSEVIWKKWEYPDIKDMKILDVDDDGIKEMICNSYAPCVEMCIGFHDYDAWLLFDSYFFILDNNGNVKQINGKEAVVQSYQGFTEFQSIILEERSEILLGLLSNYKIGEKKFITYNYTTGEVDTLEQTYTNILAMRRSGDKIVYFDQNQNVLNEYIFNQHTNRSKLLHSQNFDGFVDKLSYGVVELFNKNISLVNLKNKTTLLIDDKLNTIYTFPNKVHCPEKMMYASDNTIYYIDKTESCKMFAKVSLERNTTINPFVIIFIMSELLILFIFLVLKQVLRVPITSAKDNYFVIHSFLGLFYSWRLTGVYSRFFKLPQRVSLNKKTAYKFLYDISDKVQEFYTHSVLFIRTKVYKIHTENELSIIQRISHDLKNQILMIKLQIDEYYNGFKKKRSEEVASMLDTIKEISQVSQTLSNFSQINKLYKEKTEINSLIDQILAELHSHKNIDCIQFQSKNDFFLLVDKKLLKIGLKNLITNALGAITIGQNVTIEIKQVDHLISIIIKNPASITHEEFGQVEELGFTSKNTGSGLGIPIARSIIEKHDGKFQIILKDNHFIVEIYLPYEP